MSALRESAVRIIVVHPDLMGTYGDGGNGTVLAQRLRWRGIGAELVQAPSDSAVPATGDIYCLGGGEDGPQAQSAAALVKSGALGQAYDRGAVILAVCAGFQNLGVSFAGSDGTERPGLGLLDVSSRKGSGPRAVGELIVEPQPVLGAPTSTGFENHGGVTTLGPEAKPLGRVVSGVGNGGGDGTEGVLSDRVIGTYMHGPVLARNPALADALLSWVVGPVASLDDSDVEVLRAERLAAAPKMVATKTALHRSRRIWAGRAR